MHRPDWSVGTHHARAGQLRHGPASAARAKAEGEVDRGVLDAVRYHSIGLAEWDMVGRALYCGDYLEPGRTSGKGARAELAGDFPATRGQCSAKWLANVSPVW